MMTMTNLNCSRCNKPHVGALGWIGDEYHGHSFVWPAPIPVIYDAIAQADGRSVREGVDCTVYYAAEGKVFYVRRSDEMRPDGSETVYVARRTA